MSQYDKPQTSYVYGYTSTRPADQSYAASAQPTFNSLFPTTQVNAPHALSAAHPVSYPEQSFQPRDTAYQASSGPLVVDTRARIFPEILSSEPYSARAGESLLINIRSEIDYDTRPFTFAILFGTIVAPATIRKNFYSDPFHHYTLETSAPLTANQGSAMPLILEVQDESRAQMARSSLGQFSYHDASPFSQYAVPAYGDKKRKYAGAFHDHSQDPAKRSASNPSRARSQDILLPISDAGEYSFASEGLYAIPALYDRSIPQQRSYMSPAVQRAGHAYAGSPPFQMTKSSPVPKAYSGYSITGRTGPNPRPSVTPQHAQVATEGSATLPPNPPLIRTSILQPQAAPSFRAPGFNPYTIYPSAKAKLEIQGDLLSMANTGEWTTEEREVKRRLVEFKRRQEDSVIHASFKAVNVEERTQGANCVSCIFWEERGECFVTSVDTIQLLEGLVGVRFTVEEKNRIRRNLEGFKPLTVSKQKEDSESFFRLIMGFPNPKPRNIEKDVKVFPWTILNNALRKIIGKYSASYASTSAILTASTTQPFGASMMQPTPEHAHNTSPRSTTSSAASQGYARGVMTDTLSNENMGRPAIQEGIASYGQVMQAPQSSASWGDSYAQVITPTAYSTSHTSHTGRASWDVSAFGALQQPRQASHHLEYYGSGPADGQTQPTDFAQGHTHT